MTIPRRLLLRALADCLGAQARRLESLTPGRTAGRRDDYAAGHTADKQPGRLRKAARLREQAHALTAWLSSPESTRGPEVPGDLAAGLIALAYGHTHARREVCRQLGVGQAGQGQDTIVHLVERLLDQPADTDTEIR